MTVDPTNIVKAEVDEDNMGIAKVESVDLVTLHLRLHPLQTLLEDMWGLDGGLPSYLASAPWKVHMLSSFPPGPRALATGSRPMRRTMRAMLTASRPRKRRRIMRRRRMRTKKRNASVRERRSTSRRRSMFRMARR